MNMCDWVIQCPFCGHASSMWLDSDKGIGHNCQLCGFRQVDWKRVAISWARYEAMASGLASSEAAGIEPMFREGGRWYGKWTRGRKDVPGMPEGMCDRFAGEACE